MLSSEIGLIFEALPAVPKASLDFFDVTAVLVNDRQPLLWNRRGTVHHQVGVRDAFVDFIDAVVATRLR